MSMRRNGVMLTLICLLLCLTFNYTFPLSRENSKWNIFVKNNETLHCDKKRHEKSLERLKILPAIENTLEILDNNMKKFKKKSHNGDDLSNFEEMVIKKKNPYVDLKELELKFYNGKNSRQSVDHGSNLVEEPLVCEQENGMNVEIINRGLSGFSVPAKLLKNVGVLAKFNVANVDNDLGNSMQPAISKKQPTRRNHDVELFSALKDEIKQFEESKAVHS